MLTYEDVMTADLSKLTATAAKWDEMAAEFEKLEDRYRTQVQSVSLDGSWTGQASLYSRPSFATTRAEYAAAQKEAKAIASLLRDAHEQFVDLKRKVESAGDDAVKAGIKVSGAGVASFDFSKVDAATAHAAHHDPDLRDTEISWTQHIAAAVRAFDDADQGVKVALEAVTVDTNLGDGTMNGFNAGAKGDIEKYEAEELTDLATRLNSGEKLSGKEIAEMQRAFRDNSGDKAFSQTFLSGLGADGTIRMTNRLNDIIHVQGVKNPGDFGALEKGLANTLATATRDTNSAFYKKWRSEMREAGVEQYSTQFTDGRLDKATGYQSLVTLLSKGDGYSSKFLHDLGDDIISAEKADADIWQMKGKYSGKETGWFANDPLDGLLGVMSHDPETAASYLKSDDRMKYLMEERDWKVHLEAHEHPKVSTYSPTLDGDDRAGFGAALQAATTGIDPSDENAEYVRHSKDNEAVFKSSLKYLADSGDDFPPSLREPMAQILVNHGDTVHKSVSSVDMSESPLPQDKLFEVMKQVSKDQDSYVALNQGINQAMVADIHEADQREPEESLIRAGRTVGFLEQARTHATGDPEMAAWDDKWVFDEAIGHIPVVSGEVQAGFDYVTEKWLEDEQRRLDKEHTEKTYETYEKHNRQLMALSEEWSKVHGKRDDQLYAAKDTIDGSAELGASHASGVAGEGSK
ncbi:hypothetical protein GCM10020367_47860 [Streptomyces sannanensis]|uniref:WXG100 family type VII secretion target n=1 Tax=Streptomyces sannanensis TaxID=285536 RepID=A0ABP6SGK6_9ACTN